MIGHRECEAGHAHISKLRLLVSDKPSTEPVVALGREGTAVRITILRGLAGNPPETSCLRCLVAKSRYIPCVYNTAAGNGGFSRCCSFMYILVLVLPNPNTRYSSIAFYERNEKADVSLQG